MARKIQHPLYSLEEIKAMSSEERLEVGKKMKVIADQKKKEAEMKKEQKEKRKC